MYTYSTNVPELVSIGLLLYKLRSGEDDTIKKFKTKTANDNVEFDYALAA
jgi:hypothetical protein